MTSFRFLRFSAAVLLAAPAVASPATADTVIPFQEANGTIFIQVAVAGRPLWFIFDTGDKYAVVDLPLAQSLGLDLGPPLPVGGAGSAPVTGRLVTKGEFQVTGLPGFSQPLFIALPLADLSRAEGREVAGLLGQDFIRRFVVDIDYRAHTLTLHDKATYHYAGAGRALDVTFSAAGLPQAHAQITDAAGQPVDGLFTIDTGSTGALIFNTPFVVQSHLLQPGQATVPLQDGAGIGGGLYGKVGRITALTLAGIEVRRPYAVFAQSTGGVFADTATQGNIGSQILRKFKVTLDDDQGRIYLEPNNAFAAPLDYDMSGLALLASGADFRTFEITSVVPGSPAAAAELVAGDRLTEIDDRPARDYSLSDLRDIFRRPGDVNVTVERKGAARKTLLTLRPAF